MPFNWRVRFSLCKQQANYAFCYRAGCEQHLPTALCSQQAYSGSAYRTANLWGDVNEFHPWAVSPQKTSCMPAGVPFPSFPSLSFSLPLFPPSLQLPHFTKLPSEGTCHLYTSFVSCFSYPSSSPPLLISVTFTCSSLEAVHSDSAASSPGCCQADRERRCPEMFLQRWAGKRGKKRTEKDPWIGKVGSGGKVKELEVGREGDCRRRRERYFFERQSGRERGEIQEDKAKRWLIKKTRWRRLQGAEIVQSGLWGYETSSGSFPLPQLSHGEKTKT